MFRPQHFAPPVAVTAHVCDVPASTVAAPEVNPVTSTGKADADVEPLPS